MKVNTLFLTSNAFPKKNLLTSLLFYFFACLFVPIFSFGHNRLCAGENGKFTFIPYNYISV